MCLKISILLRVLTVVTSLIMVAFIEASLRHVRNKSGQTGCFFNFPHNTIVCDYAVGLSVVNIVVALIAIIYDFIVAVRRHGGKRHKRIDYVFCVLLALAWVACGGTMAGYDADMSSIDKEQFKDSERNYADAMVTISWITCVAWVVIVITVACSDGPPREVKGLMVDGLTDPLEEDNERDPLITKPN